MRILILAIVWALTVASSHAQDFRNVQLETQIEALFVGNRDLAEIKLSVDRMVEPSVNVAEARRSIDRMAADLSRISASANGSLEKLKILKRYVYEAGAWNGNRPFAYDPNDPLGRKPANRLLAEYLTDRHGNCVTMPILFMILGERMGLKMTLAHAPLHFFVKFTDDAGNVWNLEATSGAGFTRDSHYRKNLPMSDRAVETGLYLRPLSREETIASIATLVVEHLMTEGRFEDAIAVSDRQLRHSPRSVYLILARGSAYGGLLRRDVITKYKMTSEMPPEVKVYADHLYRENLAAFEKAEGLGWQAEDGQL
jgi:regulator of sirC expression with transglutaminase-like and TPR domain